MPFLNNGSPLTARNIWLWQAKQMHDLCKHWREGYAWEYLWNNWYKWGKWETWARAACVDYYPIIQSNAAVETHWNGLKNFELLFFNRPPVDLLCAQIFHKFLPKLYNKISRYRRLIESSSWQKNMTRDWKDLEDKIDREDEEDDRGEDPAKARELRIQRMRELHHTNVELWNCRCYVHTRSPYHLCSHLIRLCKIPHPLRGEAERQHVPPLLFITGIHEESQRYRRDLSNESNRQIESPTTLEGLGLDVSFEDDEYDKAEEIYSRQEERKREYFSMADWLEMTAQYYRQEATYGGERLCRLPPPDHKGLKRGMQLSMNARILDNSRKRRKTWAPERAGGNQYRN
jgi:hypothetical protein